MTKVFIGGSRRITRLNQEVRRRLDRIVEKRLPILIGDANGADKAVQSYLHSREYEQVEIFCMDGVCRNNVGNWNTRVVAAARGAKGREYYSTKDEQMANESSIGFMLWDGKSRGTLANISRLVDQQKKVVVYVAPTGEIRIVRTREDFATLHLDRSRGPQRTQKRHRGSIDRQPIGAGTPRLF